MEGMAVITLTEEQIKERNEARDILHAHHGLVIDYMVEQFNTTFADLNDEASNSIRKRLSELNSYYKELLPSKGFWGRAASRLTQDNIKLRAQIKELEEYKWKYEDLCK